ncbi:MAG TPA: hypothetical protein VE733_16955 [Streptosporangiaceae bacterium]|nr:hypothetical protein [Streptosporangiaceae bacterium]
MPVLQSCQFFSAVTTSAMPVAYASLLHSAHHGTQWPEMAVRRSIDRAARGEWDDSISNTAGLGREERKVADLAGIVCDAQAARGEFLALRQGDRALTYAELPSAGDSA